MNSVILAAAILAMWLLGEMLSGWEIVGAGRDQRLDGLRTASGRMRRGRVAGGAAAGASP